MIKQILFWIWLGFNVLAIIGEVTMLQYATILLITILIGADVFTKQKLRGGIIALSILMLIANLAVAEPSLIDIMCWAVTGSVYIFVKD
jgi:hypothetical protein